MASNFGLVSILSAFVFLEAGASGSGDLCTSPAFRNAFLDGAPVTMHEDYTSLSSILVGFGDRAIPCLDVIVAGKAQTLGITECAAAPEACRSWALGAIGVIGTPTARKYLIDFLGRSKNSHLLEGAALSLANLRAQEARPALLALLKHPNVKLRASTILALGVIGNRDDFEAMLAATLSLPPQRIYTGAMGLFKLGDPRAIQSLEEHLKTMTDPMGRGAIEDVLRQFEMKLSPTSQ